MKHLDKVLHFAAGLSIAFLVSLVFNPIAGLAAATFAGGLKEAWDRAHGGLFDLADWGVTVAGGFLAYAVL